MAPFFFLDVVKDNYKSFKKLLNVEIQKYSNLFGIRIIKNPH